MPLKTPVRIRNILYSSQKEASIKLGISLARIQRALNNGTIETLDPQKNVDTSIPVTLNGVRYPSLHACARETPYSLRQLQYHSRQNTLYKLEGKHKLKRNKRAIILNGERYSSIRDSIDQTEFSKLRIYKEIKRTGQQSVDCPNITLESRPRNNLKIPICIDKINFESLTEASETLGISLANLRKRIKRDTLDRLDRKFKAIPVTLHDVEYPSLAALAKAYGHSRMTVQKRYKRGTLHKLKKRTITNDL